MTEVFKSLPHFPGYSVSNLGRVKGPRRILKPQYNPTKKVWHVSLHKGDKQHTWPIHRLVLETFVGPCLDGEEGCHNDGNKANNRLDNLRWDTHVNNEADKVNHGTVSRGSRNGSSVLNEAEVVDILNRAAQGESSQSIALDLKVGRRTVSRVISRKTWGHVPWPEDSE